MRSSCIVTSVVGGLLVTLVACSQPRAGASTTDDVADSGTSSSSGEPGSDSGASSSGSSGSDSATPDAAGDATAPDPTVFTVAGNDKCADATTVPLSAASPRVELLADTTGATHDIPVPCSSDQSQSPDVFYKIAFSKRVFIYADTFGASWDTALFLLNDSCEPIPSTTAGDSVCSEGSCGTSQSQIVAVLEPGYYKIGLSGKGGAQGAATIHFAWTVAGSGAIAPLPQGTSAQIGTTQSGGGNIDGLDPASCIAAGSEDSYWWARCPSDPGGALSASTCGGTTWESVIDVQVPDGASTYKCTRDVCGSQTNLHSNIPAGAGLAVLAIDGEKGNSFGDYTMNVTRP